MPFTTQTDREKVNFLMSNEIEELLHTPANAKISVGDKCYYFYKEMIVKWKESRRWTTAHNIYQSMKHKICTAGYTDDTKRAYELAWQVFFNLKVMPYEAEKLAENGDI